MCGIALRPSHCLNGWNISEKGLKVQRKSEKVGSSDRFFSRLPAPPSPCHFPRTSTPILAPSPTNLTHPPQKRLTVPRPRSPFSRTHSILPRTPPFPPDAPISWRFSRRPFPRPLYCRRIFADRSSSMSQGSCASIGWREVFPTPESRTHRHPLPTQ